MTLRSLLERRILSPVLLTLMVVASLGHICAHADLHAVVEPAHGDPHERESNHGDACDAAVAQVARDHTVVHAAVGLAISFVVVPPAPDVTTATIHSWPLLTSADARPLFLLHASFLI